MNNKKIILKNINYVDVEKEKVNYDVDILMEDEIITNIGKTLESSDSEIIQCTNLFAVPSFIDMHVHITFNPYCDGDMSLKYVPTNLTEAAQKGICLVRDTGTSSHWLQSDILNSLPQIPLPDIIMSGEPLCVENGHGISYGIVLEYNSISQWISAHKKQGCEWIKIMNDPENHSERFIKKVVDEAHKNGLKVACHVFRKKGIELAIASGCDSIEHVVPIEYGDERSLRPYYVPTIYSAWTSCQKSYLDTVNEEDASYLIEWYELLKKHFSYAIRNNIKILCGTDAGCCPSSFKDIVYEIKTLHSMGMSRIKALQCATIDSAKCLKHDNLYGSIKMGKYANMIVVNSNPLVDLDVLNFPCLIYLKGKKIRDEVSGPWN